MNPSETEFKSPLKQFRPVTVHDSPVSSRMNLTGSARQARDNAADIFNVVQNWNEQHVAGMVVLNKIYEFKLDSLNKDGLAPSSIYSEELQKQCDVLNNICDKMIKIVHKLKEIVKYFENLKKLEVLRNSTDPLFLTWQMDNFVDVSKMVAEAYDKELKTKISIKEHVGTAKTKDQIKLYCAIWGTHPFINSSLDFKIEALLKETGHR